MPTISFFYGIVVQMYWREHPPPHFHVYYQGFEALVAIETGELIGGSLPPGAKRMIKAWTIRREQELLKNWERGRLKMPFDSIPGADSE